MDKKTKRMRRNQKARSKIKELDIARLTIHRTACHIYAQVINPDGKVVAQASTLDKELKGKCANGGNVAAAKIVGSTVAARALTKKVKQVAFDRSGFQYHGRIKALADAAREAGLEF